MLAEILEPIMGRPDPGRPGKRGACAAVLIVPALPPVGSSRGHGQHVRTQRIIDKFALNSVRFPPKN
jgi:hypothetical protein